MLIQKRKPIFQWTSKLRVGHLGSTIRSCRVRLPGLPPGV